MMTEKEKQAVKLSLACAALLSELAAFCLHGRTAVIGKDEEDFVTSAFLQFQRLQECAIEFFQTPGLEPKSYE